MTDTNSLRTGAGYALGIGLYATHGAMTEAADTIDTLRAQLAEAQKDEQRLDWLEAQVNKNGELHLHDGNHARGIGVGLRLGTLVRTLRAAIDAAKEKKNGT